VPFGSSTCVECRFLRGIIAKSDPDALVLPSEILMDDVTEDHVIRTGGVRIDDRARPQVPREYGIEFGSIQADLGEKKQETHESYDDPKLTIRGRAVADLMLHQTGAHRNE
jgi:hypothetical protein